MWQEQQGDEEKWRGDGYTDVLEPEELRSLMERLPAPRGSLACLLQLNREGSHYIQVHRESGLANPGRYSLYRKQAVWVEAMVKIFQTLPISQKRPEEDFAIPLSLTQGDGFEIFPWALAIVGSTQQHRGHAPFPTGKHYLLWTLYYKEASAVFCCKNYFLLCQRNVKHHRADSQSDSGVLCWSIHRQRRMWAQSVSLYSYFKKQKWLTLFTKEPQGGCQMIWKG